MKPVKLLLVLYASIFYLPATAQAVSKDSIVSLQQQKEVIVISKRVNDNKLKLAKLENTVEKETTNKVNTAADAQNSANNNSKAADKLTNDADDKSLAGNANKTARDAKRDAKRARKAADKLEDLNKDIMSLKSKIAADESKLTSMSGNNPNSIPAIIPPIDNN
ncbi:MAG: hypothetical protein ABJB86_18170 [Bacteroidota bacterium]